MSLTKTASVLIINNNSLFKGEFLQWNRTVGITVSCMYKFQSAKRNHSLQRNVKFTFYLKWFQFSGGEITEKFLKKINKNSMTAAQNKKRSFWSLYSISQHMFWALKVPVGAFITGAEAKLACNQVARVLSGSRELEEASPPAAIERLFSFLLSPCFLINDQSATQMLSCQSEEQQQQFPCLICGVSFIHPDLFPPSLFTRGSSATPAVCCGFWHFKMVLIFNLSKVLLWRCDVVLS